MVQVRNGKDLPSGADCTHGGGGCVWIKAAGLHNSFESWYTGLSFWTLVRMDMTFPSKS